MSAQPFSSLSARITDVRNVTAKIAGPAGLGSPPQQSPSLTTDFTLGTQAANAAQDGADVWYIAVVTIAASVRLDFDLTSFTDLLGQATNSLARLKYLRLKLLGSAEFAPDTSTAGTACSSVTIGNAGGTGTNGNVLFLTSQTDKATLQGGARGEAITREGNTPAGRAVDGTHKLLSILNNDGVNSAKLLLEFGGGTS